MTEAIVIGIYWLDLGLILVGAALGSWFCHLLERRHPEVWTSLGEPSLFLGASIQSHRRISKFLWTGAYEDLGDGLLNQVAIAARVLTFFVLILTFLAAAGFAYLRI